MIGGYGFLRGAPTFLTLSEFGRLAETFAVNEVMKQADWGQGPVTFSHFRTPDEQEVDLVIESDDGRVAGIEIKSAGLVESKNVRGPRMLRDRVGRDFLGGTALYLGARSYTSEDRLHVLPLDRLWVHADNQGVQAPGERVTLPTTN